MPAVKRSACWPQRVIIIKVGISVASNIKYSKVKL